MAIAALPGLIAIKVLTSGQANAMRANFEAILRYHERGQHAPSKRATDDHILKIVREQPELLGLLEPFLMPDQLGIIMKEFRSDAAEKT